MGVIPRMFAISLLLFLVTYIFGVMTTQLYKSAYEDHVTSADYFGRLDSTFFTLFQIMTLDNWAEITRELMTQYKMAWVPIVAFVIISGFVVVNLIIAVICDAVAALHENEKAMMHGSFTVERPPADSAIGNDNPQVLFCEELKVQLNALEVKTKELTRLQNETLLVLYRLTRAQQQH
jgi:hypothetical protein